MPFPSRFSAISGRCFPFLRHVESETAMGLRFKHVKPCPWKLSRSASYTDHM